MSLRDLATTAACAAGSGGSSSANPLAELASALLPAKPQAHTHAQAQHHQQHRQHQQHQHHAHPREVTPEETALLHADLPPQAALQPPPDLLRPHTLPPLPPVPPGDALLKQAWRRPVYAIPPPTRGAATDMFESAFASAGTRMRPAPAYHPLPTTRHAPPAYAYAPQLAREKAALEGLAALRVANQTALERHSAQAGVSGAKAGVMEREREATKEELQAVADARSWGDEFTSFENADVSAVELDVPDVYDRFIFDDTVEGAFQQWLRRDDMQEYRYANQPQASTRTAQEALDEGIREREAGRLTKAVSCFEEALNRPAEDTAPLSRQARATAWYLLGVSLAETDDDARAIQALRQGLSEWSGSAVGDRRADNPHVWQSLIALAVSYTNEVELGKALLHMREWFELWEEQHSGDSEAGIPASINVDEIEGADVLERRLNTAAAANQNDVDLFVVLGILHSLSREYGTAADAFRHAVMLRPSDPSLWNKLGATLANGGDSDDALRAYRKAVDIDPNLIRAWVNVGTAYANRSEFAKATRYYLKAISMAENQMEKGSDERMAHVWGYLRTSLISLSRPDLLQLVDDRNVQAFQTHFNF